MNAYKFANVSMGVIDMGSYASPIGLLVCVLFVLVVLISDAFLVHFTYQLDPHILNTKTDLPNIRCME